MHNANAVHAVLERHADGARNLVTPLILTARDATDAISKHELKTAVRELFADAAEIALFYFAGHGYIEDTGGFLCSSDAAYGDDGLALSEVMTWDNTSPARNKAIVLDSCHGGVTGDNAIRKDEAEVSNGVTIPTASNADQYAMETPGGGSGVFTNLFVDALDGGAADLTGDITPGSVYAHIDQSLGTWAQRPVFKTKGQGPVIDAAKLCVKGAEMEYRRAMYDPTSSKADQPKRPRTWPSGRPHCGTAGLKTDLLAGARASTAAPLVNRVGLAGGRLGAAGCFERRSTAFNGSERRWTASRLWRLLVESLVRGLRTGRLHNCVQLH